MKNLPIIFYTACFLISFNLNASNVDCDKFSEFTKSSNFKNTEKQKISRWQWLRKKINKYKEMKYKTYLNNISKLAVAFYVCPSERMGISTFVRALSDEWNKTNTSPFLKHHISEYQRKWEKIKTAALYGFLGLTLTEGVVFAFRRNLKSLFNLFKKNKTIQRKVEASLKEVSPELFSKILDPGRFLMKRAVVYGAVGALFGYYFQKEGEEIFLKEPYHKFDPIFIFRSLFKVIYFKLFSELLSTEYMLHDLNNSEEKKNAKVIIYYLYSKIILLKKQTSLLFKIRNILWNSRVQMDKIYYNPEELKIRLVRVLRLNPLLKIETLTNKLEALFLESFLSNPKTRGKKVIYFNPNYLFSKEKTLEAGLKDRIDKIQKKSQDALSGAVVYENFFKKKLKEKSIKIIRNKFHKFLQNVYIEKIDLKQSNITLENLGRINNGFLLIQKRELKEKIGKFLISLCRANFKEKSSLDNIKEIYEACLLAKNNTEANRNIKKLNKSIINKIKMIKNIVSKFESTRNNLVFTKNELVFIKIILNKKLRFLSPLEKKFSKRIFNIILNLIYRNKNVESIFKAKEFNDFNIVQIIVSKKISQYSHLNDKEQKKLYFFLKKILDSKVDKKLRKMLDFLISDKNKSNIDLVGFYKSIILDNKNFIKKYSMYLYIKSLTNTNALRLLLEAKVFISYSKKHIYNYCNNADIDMRVYFLCSNFYYNHINVYVKSVYKSRQDREKFWELVKNMLRYYGFKSVESKMLKIKNIFLKKNGNNHLSFGRVMLKYFLKKIKSNNYVNSVDYYEFIRDFYGLLWTKFILEKNKYTENPEFYSMVFVVYFVDNLTNKGSQKQLIDRRKQLLAIFFNIIFNDYSFLKNIKVKTKSGNNSFVKYIKVSKELLPCFAPEEKKIWDDFFKFLESFSGINIDSYIKAYFENFPSIKKVRSFLEWLKKYLKKNSKNEENKSEKRK